MTKTKRTLCLILTIACLNKTTAQVNKQDSLVLVDFYNNTNGVQWGVTTNWLSANPVSTWTGITVTNNRITSIELDGLYSYGMTGEMPPSVGNLENLQSLELINDSLSGAIPSSLGRLKNLEELNLSSNFFTQIPDSLGNLKNLQSLKIDENYSLYNSSIPDSLGNLSSLKSLSLDGDRLSGSIPASLGNLNNLVSLDLDFNQLSGTIPSSLGRLQNLNELHLNNNQLTGSLPDSLGNLSNLFELFLINNKLTGKIPLSFANLINLRQINLTNNLLKDSVHSFWGYLPQFVILNLSHNQLYGTIPLALGNPRTLDDISLDHNQLTGTIPDTLRNLGIVTLYLDHNKLSGKLPSWLGIKGATYISLGHNNFNGPIPDSLGTYRATDGTKFLSILDLDSAGLSGTIPESLDSLAILRSMTLAENKFTFNGMEKLISTNYSGIIISPQDTIPLHHNNNVLSVSAGGTLSNNTYTWFRNGDTIKQITGDSTFTITQNGTYRVEVTNAIATQLTLYSTELELNVLATSLLSFTAERNQNTVVLNWQITQAKNTSYFNVQRSSDGIHFSTIGKVVATGIGNSISRFSYNDVDALLHQNTLYYRIQSIDKDGSFIMSKIQLVEKNPEELFTVSPNPANSFVNIISQTNIPDARVSVISVDGKIIYNQKQNLNANSPVKIPLQRSAEGVIIIKIQSAFGNKEFKIIKE